MFGEPPGELSGAGSEWKTQIFLGPSTDLLSKNPQGDVQTSGFLMSFPATCDAHWGWRTTENPDAFIFWYRLTFLFFSHSIGTSFSMT